MNKPTQRKLAREYYDLNEQKKALEKRLDEIKSLLDYTDPTILEVDDEIVLSVVETRRFSKDLAKQLLSEEDYDAICVKVPDLKVATAYLTGAELDMLKSSSLSYTFKQNK